MDSQLVVPSRSGASGLEPDERALLETLATVGAEALRRIALRDQLQHQAWHDPLTGLANRRLFETRLERALAAAASPAPRSRCCWTSTGSSR
jgi:GAF domain-containing protein